MQDRRNLLQVAPAGAYFQALYTTCTQRPNNTCQVCGRGRQKLLQQHADWPLAWMPSMHQGRQPGCRETFRHTHTPIQMRAIIAHAGYRAVGKQHPLTPHNLLTHHSRECPNHHHDTTLSQQHGTSSNQGWHEECSKASRGTHRARCCCLAACKDTAAAAHTWPSTGTSTAKGSCRSSHTQCA